MHLISVNLPFYPFLFIAFINVNINIFNVLINESLHINNGMAVFAR